MPVLCFHEVPARLEYSPINRCKHHPASQPARDGSPAFGVGAALCPVFRGLFLGTPRSPLCLLDAIHLYSFTKMPPKEMRVQVTAQGCSCQGRAFIAFLGQQRRSPGGEEESLASTTLQKGGLGSHA